MQNNKLNGSINRLAEAMSEVFEESQNATATLIQSEMGGMKSQMNDMQGKMNDMEGKMGDMQRKMGDMQGKMGGMQRDMNDMEDRLVKRIDATNKTTNENVQTQLAHLRDDIFDKFKELEN